MPSREFFSSLLVWTIDDIHPGKSTDPYEAGGDLERGALGLVLWLLRRHHRLRVTLFVTPDWREIAPYPTRPTRHIPWLRDRLYLTKVHKKGTMSLVKHPEFVSFINSESQWDVALHGLHHIHLGPLIPTEFQKQDRLTCAAILREAIQIFDDAGLRWKRGIQPPGWNMPAALQQACSDVGLRWVACARDIFTPILRDSSSNMSGPIGLSLIYPEAIANGLPHFTSNFQECRPADRAFEILDLGGVLAIKAHIIKKALSYTAYDGVDRLYMNYLDRLFLDIEDRYGDDVWWATMDEIATRWHQTRCKHDLPGG